jgi:hypothetical protein
MRRIEFTPTQAAEPAIVSGIEQRTALQTHQRQRRSVRLSGPRGSCFFVHQRADCSATWASAYTAKRSGAAPE